MITSSDCPVSDQGTHYETHCGDLVKVLYWDTQGLYLFANHMASYCISCHLM